MTLRILLTALWCIALAAGIPAQNTIDELKSRRGTLLRQIQETESLLNATETDVAGRLNALNTLTGQIDDRKRYIARLAGDIETIDREIRAATKQIEALEENLRARKENYAASVRNARRANKVENRLLFVFSAQSVAQGYRRARYITEYAGYQRKLAGEIVARQQDIAARRATLQAAKSEKDAALSEREQENALLEEQERMQRSLVDELRRKQRGLQDEISRQRREADRLNAQIDRMIEKIPERTFALSSADRALAKNFADNRGRLPFPVTGLYTVVGKYGQYSVEGLKNVRLDNKGIDIQTPAGSEARAIFEGEVTAVFQVPGSGLFNVLIRHGDYISVYCNLAAATVKVGDRVSTRQPIGPVYSDKGQGNRTVLHFQLRRERNRLNPEHWLDRSR